MLPGRMGCWPAVLLLVSFHQAHMTTTESSTYGGCLQNISKAITSYRTVTTSVRTTTTNGWLFWKRTRTKYRKKTSKRMDTGTMVVQTRVPCNTTDPARMITVTNIPVTGDISNSSNFPDETGALPGQQDEEPSSGQIAGFVIGVIALVTAVVVTIVVVVIFIRRRRRRKQSPSSGKSKKQTASSSETSQGAVLYYEPPEAIRERKRRQREANQDPTKLSNKTEYQGQVTDLDETVYSYNHLREANDLQGGSQLVTNTYGHLQDGYRAKIENEGETSLYYNLEAKPTSAETGAGQNVPYDNLRQLGVAGKNESAVVTRYGYDHVQIDRESTM